MKQVILAIVLSVLLATTVFGDKTNRQILQANRQLKTVGGFHLSSEDVRFASDKDPTALKYVSGRNLSLKTYSFACLKKSCCQQD